MNERLPITLFLLLVCMNGCADTQQLPLATANKYATKFPTSEYPISENGKWIGGFSTGLDWSDIGTIANSNAYPVMKAGDYADATALLNPATTGEWGSNETVILKVFDSTPGTTKGEVAVRCHSAITPHSNEGYEIGWRLHATDGAYNGVTRWNGPYGNFEQVGTLNKGSQYGLENGDVVVVTCSETGVITGYKCPGGANCIQQISVRDTTFLGGTPGFGLDAPTGTQLNYGISSFSANDGPIQSVVAPN
jgi:hypothetical protein